MGSQESYTGIELSAAESWTLLRGSVVGRLAVIVDDRPEIFPINHVVDHDSVVFRTGTGTKVAGAVGHPVAFEVDGYDVDTASAWSVVVKGHAQEVNLPYDVLFELPLIPWHTAPKPYFVRIEPDGISGRRFEVTGRARSAAPFVPLHRAADE
jgi:hypothetical protein